MEDFRKDPSSWERPQSLPPLDDHFDGSAAARIEQESSKMRETRLEALQLSLGSKTGGDGEDGAVRQKRNVGRVQKRACTHPAFRNAKNDEVDRELRDAGPAMVGEALIRPSSKSSDSLAIHWVVKEGSVKVVEIIEEEKETDTSIGNKLKIKVRCQLRGNIFGCILMLTICFSLLRFLERNLRRYRRIAWSVHCANERLYRRAY
jgi:transcription elongation factor SPT6